MLMSCPYSRMTAMNANPARSSAASLTGSTVLSRSGGGERPHGGAAPRDVVLFLPADPERARQQRHGADHDERDDRRDHERLVGAALEDLATGDEPDRLARRHAATAARNSSARLGH